MVAVSANGPDVTIPNNAYVTRALAGKTITAPIAGGVPIPWDQGQPGDIVGFPGHVAIYLGTIDGQRYILEASWVGTPIRVVPLTWWLRWLSSLLHHCGGRSR